MGEDLGCVWPTPQRQREWPLLVEGKNGGEIKRVFPSERDRDFHALKLLRMGMSVTFLS